MLKEFAPGLKRAAILGNPALSCHRSRTELCPVLGAKADVVSRRCDRLTGATFRPLRCGRGTGALRWLCATGPRCHRDGACKCRARADCPTPPKRSCRRGGSCRTWRKGTCHLRLHEGARMACGLPPAKSFSDLRCQCSRGEFNDRCNTSNLTGWGGGAMGCIHGYCSRGAEGRTLGALEERAKCCGHLAGAGTEDQDRRGAIVVLHGGIAPARRRRAWAALRLEEREEMFPWHCGDAGQSGRSLKASDGRHRQSVGRSGATAASGLSCKHRPIGRTWERALRPSLVVLALHGELRWRVAQKLALQWSPEQISAG